MATKGEQSATKNGEKFQDQIWDLSEEDKKILFNTDDISCLVNTDSKVLNCSYKQIRNKLLKDFVLVSEKMKGIHSASALRGDIVDEDKKIIYDIKNYDKIKGQFKFPSDEVLSSDGFIKGIDSNIKYALFYFLNKFYNKDLEDLKNYFFSKSKNETLFDQISNKYKNRTAVSQMDKKNFIDLFLFMELGFGWNIKGVKPIKRFISQVDNTNIIENKEVNLYESLSNDKIDVQIKIEKDYTYLYFLQNENCIYIISHRKDKANCSFINRNYLKKISSIDIK